MTSSAGVPDIAIGGASEFCVMITAAAPVTDQLNPVCVHYASHYNFLSICLYDLLSVCLSTMQLYRALHLIGIHLLSEHSELFH